MQLESALRGALRHRELLLHYQPQIDLLTQRVIEAEALVRWLRPGHGLVMPGDFIGIAETAGLIAEIGEWVLRTACKTVAFWNHDRTGRPMSQRDFESQLAS